MHGQKYMMIKSLRLWMCTCTHTICWLEMYSDCQLRWLFIWIKRWVSPYTNFSYILSVLVGKNVSSSYESISQCVLVRLLRFFSFVVYKIALRLSLSLRVFGYSQWKLEPKISINIFHGNFLYFFVIVSTTWLNS